MNKHKAQKHLVNAREMLDYYRTLYATAVRCKKNTPWMYVMHDEVIEDIRKDIEREKQRVARLERIAK